MNCTKNYCKISVNFIIKEADCQTIGLKFA